MWIVILVLLLALIIYLLVSPKGIKLEGRGLISFVSRGLDAGFKFNQILLLWKASSLAGLERPSDIYWSLDELDRCMHILIEKFGLLKHGKAEETQKDLLRRLFDYRKRVEFNKPQYKMGIRTTRDIPLNQTIKIRQNQVGIYESTVVANADTYLLVDYPRGDALPIGFGWRGRLLNVYFWKEGDAGYFFESKFLDHFESSEDRKYLRMAHSDYLLRSQKRRSVRAACNIPAQLFRFNNTSSFQNNIERNDGLYAILLDISEDGAALRMAGRGKKGMAVKIQFRIKDITVVMNGIVRSCRYDRNKDQSLLHMENMLPLKETHRFAILAFVYDVDRSRKKTQDKKEAAIEKYEERKKAREIPPDATPVDAETLPLGELEEAELEELGE